MTNQDVYDVIIIGAGPAGIFTAFELAKLGIKRVLIVEKGLVPHRRKCPRKEICLECSPCSEIEGVGGAGGFSDGKLCNGPVGIDKDIIGEDYLELVNYVNNILIQFLGHDYKINQFSKTISTQIGHLSISTTPVIRLGSIEIREAFAKMFDFLSVSKETRAKATDILPDKNSIFVITTKTGKTIRSRRLIIATGKCGFTFREKVIKVFSLKTTLNTPQIGVRLETSFKDMEGLLKLGPNPKIKRSFEYGHVKTHCFNHRGEVMVYKCGPFVLVGGRLISAQHLTQYSNVNIVYKILSREKVPVVFQTLQDVKRNVGLSVLSQNLLEFLKLKPLGSTTRNPYLLGATTVDFIDFYPEFVITSLKKFIEDMVTNNFLTLSDDAFVYGPAIEWLLPKVSVNEFGETSKPGLFIIGDASGKTQGIIAASIMGVRAARKIAKSL